MTAPRKSQAKPQGITLGHAVRAAGAHWSGRPGGRTMDTGALACVAILGAGRAVSTLGPPDAVTLLAALRSGRASPGGPGGRSSKTVAVYYGAFRRALALSGVSTEGWPVAPKPPRKTREPIPLERLDAVIKWLRKPRPVVGCAYRTTADLGVILRATGMRVNVEALTGAHLEHRPGGDDYDVLHVTGKGGHERLIPVLDPEARTILAADHRMAAIRATAPRTHRERWAQACKACGVPLKARALHSVRHAYATDALKRTGGNLRVVQELLGHASPKTTADYIAVDMADTAKALSPLSSLRATTENPQ